MQVVLQVQEDVAVDFLHRVTFHALGGFVTFAGLQIEMMRVQGTNDFAAPDQTFRQRSLPMRTSVLQGEYSAIALTEDGDLFGADNVAPALTQCDRTGTSQVN